MTALKRVRRLGYPRETRRGSTLPIQVPNPAWQRFVPDMNPVGPLFFTMLYIVERRSNRYLWLRAVGRTVGVGM